MGAEVNGGPRAEVVLVGLGLVLGLLLQRELLIRLQWGLAAAVEILLEQQEVLDLTRYFLLLPLPEVEAAEAAVDQHLVKMA